MDIAEKVHGDRRRAAIVEHRRRRAVSRASRALARVLAARASTRRMAGLGCASGAPSRAALRASAVRPSALHPVFIRHDRRAEMHRARRRRHAAAASEGASCCIATSSAATAVLLHDLRLDDVELARVGPRRRARRSCSTTARPSIPTASILFDFAERRAHARISAPPRNTSTRSKKAGLKPRETHELLGVADDALDRLAARAGELRLTSMTRSSRDLHLASISGGTDIVSLLRRSAIRCCRCGAARSRCRGLGMAVDVFDDDGPAGARRKRASSSARAPFPSMPVGFWNDPDGEKYHAAYFERFPGVWCHGDFAEWTEHGGIVIHGRSDATLNPGGVRIGTAEIYRQVEQMPEVARSARDRPGLGQRRARSCCSCACATGVALDDALRDAHQGSRSAAARSPRHVPAKIIAGRRHSAHQVGQDHRARGARRRAWAATVKNKEALANPEALDSIAICAELKD